jgi:2-C-methyl-D-erythritol 4-phosphate cytidylyltransferase
LVLSPVFVYCQLTMKYYAIIVAGGTGSRMNTATPKQFMLLDGKPILMHTMAVFQASILKPEILLVLNIHQHEEWETLCQKYNFDIPHRVIKGGEERFHSVNNGLKMIKGAAVVAIHDAVRPLVSSALITQSFERALENGNAVAGVQPTDSVRMRGDAGNTTAIDRSKLFLIQTPQTFKVEQLRKAYQQPYRNDFTDDASVVERAGFEVHVIPGERENIKITFKEDLIVAELYLKREASE